MTEQRELRHGPLAWMTHHRVAPNLLMLVLILGGLFMSTKIKQEVFPEFELDSVSIRVALPGASPQEVEEGVILAIEEELRDLDGIEEIQATAGEASASIVIEMEVGADHAKIYQDIQQAVDRVDTFPDDAEEPRISMDTRRRSVLDLQLYGAVDEWNLRQAAEQVRDRLLQQSGITQVELEGVRDLEIHLEVSQARLREYGLTLDDIARTVEQAALDRSGGSVETRGGEILLRVQERREWAREFGEIPVVVDARGAAVRLGDVAEIREGFAESDTFATFNGERAIGITVYRVGEQTPASVSEATRAALPGIMAELPPAITAVIEDDDSEIYQQRVNLLLKNGFIGLVLVLVLLSLFLEFKLAFWVTVGIPTAFLGTLLFLPVLGASLNMVSLFAFILALGIVVDDAIVAGENIYEYRQRGMDNLQAAIRGAHDIAVPISFSILTNMVAFLPMMTVPGSFGKIWAVIPLVVITAFTISWVEALFILPAHLAHTRSQSSSKLGARLHAWQQSFSLSFRHFIKDVYGPLLDAAIRFRYLTVALMILILLLVLALPMSGRMGFILMPKVESDYALATATLPVGSPPRDARSVRDRLVSAASAVIDANGGEQLGSGIFALVRENSVEVRVYLQPAGQRPLSTQQVTGLWRKQAGDIPGLEKLRYASDSGGPGRGASVSIELSHSDITALENAAAELAAMLEEFSSAKDVDNGFAPGKVQLDFHPTTEALSLGLSSAEIARQVRAAFYGAEALKQQRGRNEVTVMARLPEVERQSEADVENLILILPGGGEVPLYKVASVERGRAYTEITRRDARRTVTVTANVEPISDTSRILASVEAELLPRLVADYPGISYSFEGRQAHMRDAVQSFFSSVTIALIIIYFLLAIPFRSYIQPLIIMMAIPFGVVGAILGHLLMGYSLSIISIMGIIALGGVLINDSLVMIDYANKQRLTGLDAFHAIHQAGIRRFRPILLTTLTTFGGLAPMIFETSRQARFLIPMALSLGYGILFGTAIILLLTPCLYMIIEDIKHLAGIDVEPAAGEVPAGAVD